MNKFHGSGSMELASCGRKAANCVVAASEQQSTLGPLQFAESSCRRTSAANGPQQPQLKAISGADDRFVSQSETATFLGVSRSTLFRLRRGDPTFPEPVRFSSGVMRFRLSDLLAWAVSKSSR